MTNPIPVAVLGATGYAGEHSVRILLGHPAFEIVHLGSDRFDGTPYGKAVPAFAQACDLPLRPDTPEQLRASGAQAIVLAKKSPEVTRIVPALVAAGIRLVDIGAEFRLRDEAAYRRWYGEDHACPDLLASAVYGLSEIHGEAIRAAQVVGNPGCYATSILLPLIPLLAAGLIDRGAPIAATGLSGLSGAGKRFVERNNNLFWAANENVHCYKPLVHQHTAELDQELSLAAGAATHLHFTPHLVPLTRGIHSTISLRLVPGVDQASVLDCWRSAYHGRPFVRIRDQAHEVEIAHVTASNHCDLGCAVDGEVAILTSAIDNLVKGASGQAIQNLNLMFKLDETTGLLNRSL